MSRLTSVYSSVMVVNREDAENTDDEARRSCSMKQRAVNRAIMQHCVCQIYYRPVNIPV